MPGMIERIGCGAQHGAALGDHAAPGDAVGVAEAEEGQAPPRSGWRRRRSPTKRQHRRQGVGQHLAEGDLQGMHADDAGAGDVVALADRQDFGAGDAGRSGPGAEARSPRRRCERRADDADEGQCQQEAGTVWKASVSASAPRRRSRRRSRPACRPRRRWRAPPPRRPARPPARCGRRGTSSASTSRPSRSVPSGSDQSVKGGSSAGPAIACGSPGNRQRRRAARHGNERASRISAGDRLRRVRRKPTQRPHAPASLAPTRGSRKA